MQTGIMKWELGETAYTIHGELTSGKTPLVTLHGGPGFLGRGMDTIAGYAQRFGRTAITYDQIGCGGSSHLKEKPTDFWQVKIFVDEFLQLIEHLEISDSFALIGHSWGGLLAAEIAITQPEGLKSLILSSPLGDSDVWVSEVKRLLSQMPAEISSVILAHEEAGTTNTEEYLTAAFKFYDKHVIRVPMPPDVVAMFDEAMADQNVYNSMWGPSELMCNGTLAGHVVTDRVNKIIAPTLIISGKYDECTPKTAQAYHAGIKGSKWEIFEESSHLTYVEEAAKYQRVMNEFLETTT
jgi:L-proline amide hydrolase